MVRKMEEIPRETVGVFRDINALNDAVAELEDTEFTRQDISVIGGEKDIEREFGTTAIKSRDLEDNPEAPRSILIRPEEKVIGSAFMAGGGVYAGALTALLIAGAQDSDTFVMMAVILGGIIGGAIGAAVAWFLNHNYKKHLETRLKQGGMVLWVHTADRHRERVARQILKRHGGIHVHAHDV